MKTMNEYAEIIFYHSGQTAEIEKVLSSELSLISLSISQVRAAMTAEVFSDMLENAFQQSNVIFIIGESDGNRQVIEQFFSANHLDGKFEPLTDDYTAGIVRYGEKCVILLPDDAEQIKTMFAETIREKLSDGNSQNEYREELPSIESIIKEMDSRLSYRKRTPVGVNRHARQNRNKTLAWYRVSIFILILLGIIQAVLAVVFLTTGQ